MNYLNTNSNTNNAINAYYEFSSKEQHIYYNIVNFLEDALLEMSGDEDFPYKSLLKESIHGILLLWQKLIEIKSKLLKWFLRQ